MDRQFIKKILEDAPKEAWNDPDLLGWRLPNGLTLCGTCAARIMARGFNLPRDSVPLWRDREFPTAECAGCGSKVE